MENCESNQTGGVPRRSLLHALPWITAFGSSAGLADGVIAQFSFEDGPLIDIHGYATNVMAGEFTGDDLVDLVAMDASGYVILLENDGDGGFHIAARRRLTSGQQELLHGGDIDVDGLPDFAWSNGKRLNILYLDDFEGHVRNIHYDDDVEINDFAFLDLNRDQYLDLVTLNDVGVNVRLNLQGRSFSTRQQVGFSMSHKDAMDFGDFDQDGDVDIAVLQTEYYEYYSEYKVDDTAVSVLTNDGRGDFSGYRHQFDLPYRGLWKLVPFRLVAGDLDNDSDPDLAVQAGTFAEAELVIVNNIGPNLNFAVLDPIPIPFGSNGYSDIVLGDPDMDGDLDVIVGAADNQLDVFTNVGQMNWDTIQTIAFGANMARGQARLDYDHDGRLDFAIVEKSEGIKLIRNTSTDLTLNFDVSLLERGAPATFNIEGGVPGRRAHVLFRRGIPDPEGGGRLALGLTVELGDQYSLLGTNTIDANGRTSIRIDLPRNAPTAVYTFQALQGVGPEGEPAVKSGIVTRRIR